MILLIVYVVVASIAVLVMAYIQRNYRIVAERNDTELKRLTTMLSSSDIGTWRLIQKPGHEPVLICDSKMKQLMGLPYEMSPEQLLVEQRNRIHPDDVEKFKEYDKKLKTGQHAEIIYRWLHPTLGERYIRCGGVEVKTRDGSLVSNGYHYDVTDTSHTEIELQKSIIANATKTKFLQNMSHEIRTPLNAMYGFSQLLGMPDGSWTDEERQLYVKYIHTSYNMLDMLINDILDLADSTHGNYRMVIGDTYVNDTCRNAMMAVEFRCPNNVKMYFTSDLPDSHVIKSDNKRIQQVLINFLSNACKHTRKGEIHMHCARNEETKKIILSVTDTGRGVPPEMADSIFGRYTKLNQDVQGSGLGLNICNIIAEKLEGKVYLDTTYTEGGARFVFEINDKTE